MDWRWPVLFIAVLLTGAAGAGAWFVLRPGDVAFAGLAGLAAAGVGVAMFEMSARARSVSKFGGELKRLKKAQASFEKEIALAREGMVAVHQAIAQGGGAHRQKLQAMADEMAVLQKLVTRLQTTAAEGAAAGKRIVVERSTAGLLSEEEILSLVQDALSEGAMDIYLQPVVSLPQRQRRFYECLSRVPDQRGGVLAADAYVAAAEAAGLIAPIDNLLLFRAVQLVRRARAAGVGFFCNVSRHTLKDKGFLEDFLEFLRDNVEIAPSLIMELNQADWDPEDEELARYMASFTALGVRFSLDHVEDFSFDPGLLRRRGVAFVKAPAAALLAEGAPDVFGVKRRLEMERITLIVERVESDRDLVELLEFDISLGQGYLFGAPKALEGRADAA